jgi:hypothetical protein
LTLLYPFIVLLYDYAARGNQNPVYLLLVFDLIRHWVNINLGIGYIPTWAVGENQPGTRVEITLEKVAHSPAVRLTRLG